VLVVDDDPATQEVVSRILRDAGHSVIAVGTAREALAQLPEAAPLVLLTDYKLPDQDGLSLLKEAARRDHQLMVIVMTGYGDVDLAVKALKLGASDFLTKPLQRDLLLASVGRLFELHRLHHENAVLKRAALGAVGIRLRPPTLADFGRGDAGPEPEKGTEFERGVREGERRAAERDAASHRAAVTLLTDITRRLESTWDSLHARIGEDIAALALSLAEQIVRESFQERRERVVEQLKTALAHVPDARVITIIVHPLDIPLLEAAREAIAADRKGSIRFEFHGDASISQGGCLVKTETRVVDATLETQLSRLGDVLRKRKHRAGC
jgi:DNA-binding response OmpR family regulator/F0F1-type ATP synthase delta subunit